MKRIAVFLMLLMAVTAAKAQEATVKRVELLANEVIAVADRRKDLNDSYCALVRVEVLADDVQFSGNIIGPVEHRTGHYRVFVSPGTRFLRIESGTFLPVMIDTREYGIQGMQSNCTYVVTLSLPSAAPAPASAGMNYLVMTVTPANARVTVDGKEREVRNGNVKVLLSNGTYTYRVEAPGYLPDEGSVTINNARADRTVALRSNKGTLAVSSATPGTEIYVNGERVGAGSWRGELLPDNYLVEGRLAGHRTTEQVVAVATGQTATVTLPALTAITGSLNIDYEPVGAKITIDGTDRGTTPAVIANLTVGTHTVTHSA
ncbi:MAG: PEGA domain-containing protein, partial [Muribaculaceae bacterium]|nr:PEGA domain-containing protein [Muribaculaceae bacterium]